MIETKLNNLEINELTEEQFKSVKNSDSLNPIALYMTPSLESVIIPISQGGTNAQTVQEARQNLGFEYGSEVPTHIPETGDGAVYFKIDDEDDGVTPIEHGGTGAITGYDALRNLGAMDYVVEQGTSGIWTYRKWNSGIAECWGRYKGASGLTMTTAWGSLYFGTINPISFPENVGFVTDIPTLQIHAESGNAWAIGYAPSLTQTHTIYCVSAKPVTDSLFLSLYAQGRWK